MLTLWRNYSPMAARMREPRQELAPDPKVAAVLRWPTAKSKAWTTKFLESARKHENILAVVAIGSAVRQGVSSADLDLVVICRRPEKLKERPPIEIDLRAYAAADVDALIRSGNDLLGWAVTYGKPLFQRNRFWDHVRSSWRNKVPLPSIDIALQRAEKSYRRFAEMLDLQDYEAAHEQALSCLTHLARAKLLAAGKHPASRPELPANIRTLGHSGLADSLQRLIDGDTIGPTDLKKILQRLTAADERLEMLSAHAGRASTESRTNGRKR